MITPTVLLAAVVGYGANTILVAEWQAIRSRTSLDVLLRQMHSGVLGEFVVSYMGLALFSVMVAITTRTIGLWAIAVFIAPLAFAWQMFHRPIRSRRRPSSSPRSSRRTSTRPSTTT